MNNSLLSLKPSVMLRDFLANYAQHFNIDTDDALHKIKNLVKYYGGSNIVREELRYLIELEDIWYKSLAADSPDYSVYDDDYYFTDLWACWIVYSRGYLRSVRKSLLYQEIQGLNSIVDLGCGIGYTTAALKDMFNQLCVYGTNLPGTKQYKFCEAMAQKHGFVMVSDINAIADRIDVVFASEYFEHIETAANHLFDIVERLSPKIMIIANSFNTRSVGHFLTYHFNGFEINQASMSKVFNLALKRLGYSPMKLGFWNNRPNVWVRL